jgi:hypothetical protein
MFHFDNPDDWDGHNGLIDIKLYATRVCSEGMGTYGSNNGHHMEL